MTCTDSLFCWQELDPTDGQWRVICDLMPTTNTVAPLIAGTWHESVAFEAIARRRSVITIPGIECALPDTDKPRRYTNSPSVTLPENRHHGLRGAEASGVTTQIGGAARPNNKSADARDNASAASMMIGKTIRSAGSWRMNPQ
jgi:hypothetical protein